MSENIIIKGARENNLKNIDLTIPRSKFIVFTGLSGSGKSSLAFDTIYAEGQRRYVESLSAYARQFLGQMNKPDVDSIEGLSPAISIDQKTTNKNPRSTVGTVTEIYDYFRLLYARIGIPHCPKCGKVIQSQSIDTIVDEFMAHEEGARVQILAPVVRGEKGTFRTFAQQCAQKGYIRAIVDGEQCEFSEWPELNKNQKHHISIIVDRIIIKDSARSRITDSVETALKLANGLVIKKTDDDEKLYSENFACVDCGISMQKPEPRDFSFNSPFGMCPECNGIGYHRTISKELLMPDKNLSLSQGALGFYNTDEDGYYFSIISELAKAYGVSLDTPVKDVDEKFLDALFYGDENTVLKIKFNSYFSGYKEQHVVFEGVINNLMRRHRETGSEMMRERIEKYMIHTICHACNGKKLNENSLSVLVAGKNIIDVTEMSIGECIEFLNSCEFTDKEINIAHLILKEINSRLGFLSDVGLNYLSLSRSAGSLSGGESQRIRLATQIGSQLTGVLYVLDEPSIGLHQRDNEKLIASLRHLTDLGNTLIVVEHDEDTMRQADHIVDIGPGAGENGGEIIASGNIDEIISVKESITGQYLSGEKKISVPKERISSDKFLTVKGAKANNLKNIDVSFPIGVFTCVTGVSGSGKSTLVNEILAKAMAKKLHRALEIPAEHDSVMGDEHLDKIITIDQSPIGRTPRSNPATYTGMFDLIRDLFASTNEAKMKGYKKGRFSFNVKGGRCESCMGDGIVKIEMNFLPDVYVACEVCGGKRYNNETLAVTYKGKNISDVLDMSVDEAMEFFENQPKIYDKVKTLYDVGLGYIRLGQPSTTISGGEAQRVKLATELSRRSTGKTLYILDEPTTGLHTADVDKLLEVLTRLRDAGNTIIVIEHNLDVIKCADHIIDLGPEGGDEGGNIIATGTPEEVSMVDGSYTGMFLKKVLNK